MRTSVLRTKRTHVRSKCLKVTVRHVRSSVQSFRNKSHRCLLNNSIPERSLCYVICISIELSILNLLPSGNLLGGRLGLNWSTNITDWLILWLLLFESKCHFHFGLCVLLFSEISHYLILPSPLDCWISAPRLDIWIYVPFCITKVTLSDTGCAGFVCPPVTGPNPYWPAMLFAELPSAGLTGFFELLVPPVPFETEIYDGLSEIVNPWESA